MTLASTLAKSSIGKKPIRVAVGLSGGVDSSIVAMLLKKQGYEVTGVHMRCWDYDVPGCRGNIDRADAVKVAAKLEIQFVDLNFEKEYKELVLKYFFDEIKLARTPNPDVLCNQEIKFGIFLDWALKNGFDYVATGHYARIKKVKIKSPDNSNGGLRFQSNSGLRYQLLSGKDQSKDQSYFLYRLNQKQLSKSLYPLGGLTKQEVRKLAKESGLHNWDKKDSTGICFIGDIDVREFIKANVPTTVGKVVDISGRVVGEHDGVELYTIGQRHGFRLAEYIGLPVYVIRKEAKNNTLIVGFGKDAQSKNFKVSDISFIDPLDSKIQKSSLKCLVRIRNLGEKLPGVVKSIGPLVESKIIEVILNDYANGVAPGQSAVFYLDDRVIGGGSINSST